MGEDGILIANAPAPSVADPSLNGITIEFEHCAGDQKPHDLVGQAGGYLVTHPPTHSLTHSLTH